MMLGIRQNVEICSESQRLNHVSSLYVMALDIGSSAVRVAWFDEYGKLAAIASRSRQDKNTLDDLFTLVTELAMSSDERLRENTIGLAVAAASPELVLLNEKLGSGQPISLWRERSLRGAEAASQTKGITPFGNRVPPESILAKAFDVKEWDNVAWVADLADAMTSLLSGEAVRSRSCAVWGLLLDEQVQTLPQLATRVPSKITYPGEPVGKLTVPACNRLGLPEGVSVIAGGIDGMLASLVCGIFERGVFVLVAGSTHVLQGSGNGKEGDSWYGPLRNPLGTGMDLATAVWESGIAWQGLATLFTDGDIYKLEDFARRTSSCRQVVAMAGWWGSRTINSLREKGWIGIDASTTVGMLARSLAEGIVKEGNRRINALRSAGWEINRIVMTGGFVSRPWWIKLHQELLCVPVSFSLEPYGTLRGAAACAATGVGWRTDLKSSARLFSCSLSN